MKSLGKIIRSVQAFGRGLSGLSGSGAGAAFAASAWLSAAALLAASRISAFSKFSKKKISLSAWWPAPASARLSAPPIAAASPSPELEQMATRVRFKDFARWTLSRYGFASNERMIKFLSSILKVKTFEELQIPLAVTATDFSTGAGSRVPLRTSGRSRCAPVALIPECFCR